MNAQELITIARMPVGGAKGRLAPAGCDSTCNRGNGMELAWSGLGVMECHLLLNMMDHGFSVADCDKDPYKVEALRKVVAHRDISGTENIHDFTGLLGQLRVGMMLVPADTPLDPSLTICSRTFTTGAHSGAVCSSTQLAAACRIGREL